MRSICMYGPGPHLEQFVRRYLRRRVRSKIPTEHFTGIYRHSVRATYICNIRLLCIGEVPLFLQDAAIGRLIILITYLYFVLPTSLNYLGYSKEVERAHYNYQIHTRTLTYTSTSAGTILCFQLGGVGQRGEDTAPPFFASTQPIFNMPQFNHPPSQSFIPLSLSELLMDMGPTRKSTSHILTHPIRTSNRFTLYPCLLPVLQVPERDPKFRKGSLICA